MFYFALAMAFFSSPLLAIEEVIEPYLMQEGLVQRTPRGRVLTAFGFQQIGLKAPSVSPTLFDNEEQ